MRKLIHSKFELDLSNFNISETEENNWFSDSFFTKYLFPFEINLDKDLDVAFGFISEYNTNPVTYYECKYLHDNYIGDAIFEIDQMQEKLSATLRFGFEELPSFDKKLSELSLDVFDLPTGVSIYQHAETIINQTWPAVNYNFPQIHTDKYDTGQFPWGYFTKIINNRINGAFLTNYYDTINIEEVNRSIMQPLPYWIHILKRGMFDANYILSGEILNDVRLQKACLFSVVDYYKTIDLKFYNINIQESERYGLDAPDGNHFRNYFYKSITINDIGFFILSGSFNLNYGFQYGTYLRIYHNGTMIYDKTDLGFNGPDEYNEQVEFTINFTTNNNLIEIRSMQLTEDFTDREVCDFDINTLAFGNVDGTFNTSVYNENKINLKKAVPDMTFGDFVKMIKNYFNYDLTIVGNLAIMNKVESKINYNDVLDLQFSEVKRPIRKFHSGVSYLLKFVDVEYPAKPYLPVFQNQSTVVTSGFKTDERTNTIEINALPLPLLNRNGVDTAFASEDDNSKPYLVVYDGLVNGKNISKPIDEYLLPSVHAAYWRKWFDLRIKPHSFSWSFKSWIEKIIDLKAKTKVYAFGNVHIIKSITKTQLKEDLYQIDLETESIK